MVSRLMEKIVQGLKYRLRCNDEWMSVGCKQKRSDKMTFARSIGATLKVSTHFGGEQL
jgi:hypothetical protein